MAVAVSSKSMPSVVSPWPAPEGGASLLLAFTPPHASTSTNPIPARRTALIVGSGRLAAVRTFACLEAGLSVAVLPCSSRISDPELEYRISSGQLALLETTSSSPSDSADEHDWLSYIQQSIPQDILNDILLVCITDTISSASASTSSIQPRSPASALDIRKAFFKLRIPVNVADYPALSDFHFPATHRFPLSASSSSHTTTTPIQTASPLQIAITTNGNSCRLASRLRREIVGKLPRDVGSAVASIGKLRQQARQIDNEEAAPSTSASWHLDAINDIEQGEREEGWSSSLLNKPVPQILAAKTAKVSLASVSKCTSPNRISKKTTPTLDPSTSRPLHPSQLPLTPPATPPLRALAQGDNIDFILAAGDAAREIVPPSLTRMRFIAQICRCTSLSEHRRCLRD